MTAQPTTPDVGPWYDRLPPALREQVDAGRAAPRWIDLDEHERARREAEDRRAALLEHLDDRAQVRWATWCRMVADHYGRYADPSAAAAREDNAQHWLRRLDPRHQHPAAVAEWLASDSETLVLVGDPGTGKTHMAVCAGYAAAGSGLDVRIVSHLDYLLALRPGGSDSPGRERDLASGAAVLVLDDLGAEGNTAADGFGKGDSRFVREETCALLDRRLAAGRRQIITTNLTPPELANALGPRIVSRLQEGVVALGVTGPDRRSARTRVKPTWL